MDYSLEFLKTDWTGAGFDFLFRCDFVNSGFELDRVNQFLERVGQDFSFVSFVSDPPASEVSEWVRSGDFENRRPFLKNLPGSSIMWLRHRHHHTPDFFIRIYPPNEIQVGAEPEYFYSGSFEEDRLRAEYLVRIVSWGCEIFGDAIAAFAAGGWADRLVQERADANEGSNLTQDTDWKYWVDYVVHACNEMREVG